MPTIPAENLRIHYEEQGSGPPLILIGGLTSTLEVFGLNTPGLSRTLRVITPDNRGSGRSIPDPDDSRRPITRFAEDVRVLLNGLGIDQCHLLGVSMGGFVVQEFAVTWPERLLTLTVACSAPFSLAHPDAQPPDPETMTPFTDTTPMSREDDDARTLRNIAHPDTPRTRPDRARFYLETKWQWPHSQGEVLARLAGVAEFDVADRLHVLADVPVLVLAGEDDRLVKPGNSRRLAQLIPGAKFVTFEKTAHIFFVEEPEKVNRAVLEFIGNHGV